MTEPFLVPALHLAIYIHDLIESFLDDETAQSGMSSNQG